MTQPDRVSAGPSNLLDIELEPATEDGFHPVRLDRDGAVTRTRFKNPFGKEGLIKAAARLDVGLVTEVTTKSIGSELFQALFGDATARSVFDASQGEGRTRLRFIAGDGEATAIPWELLYDSRREEYLAHSGSISRWIRVSAEISTAPRPTMVRERLRILVVLANPLDDGLDLDAEAEAIEETFAMAVKHDRAKEVELLPQATLSRLQSAITSAANDDRPFHIVHFAGHTGQDPGNPLPYLRLEADDHHDGKVDPETFANVVTGPDKGDVRLVFLNACGSLQAGESRSGRLFPSFAGELLRRGVPAIVGTQSPVLDSFATRVAHEFYRSLLDGNPVDEALAQVRELIHGDRLGEYANFGIPVCYLSGGDGRIIEAPLGRIARWRESLTPRTIFAIALFVAFTLIPGVIWYVDRLIPDPPPPMVGDFNVGVAGFEVLEPETEDGREVAVQLAGSLYERLRDDDVLDCARAGGEAGSGGRIFGCQGPDTVPAIEGDDEERARAAADYAETARAHLVVYGTVADDAGFATFRPAIYLSGRGLRRAEELTGTHELEARTGPVESSTQKRSFRGEAEQLAVDLGDLSDVLSYYSDAEYRMALEILTDLMDRATFDLDRSLLHLVAGNLYLDLSVTAEDQAAQAELVDAAEAEYQASKEETPGYARGWLGLGEISYQRGRGTRDCVPGSVDQTHLDESIDRYQRSRTEPVSPAAANVDLKAAFGIGRTDACLSTAGVADRWDEAKDNLMEVVEAFEAGARGLDEFASESYSLIAYIDLETASTDEDRRRALEQSIDLNTKASAATNDPTRIGVFSYLIADAYRQLGRTEEACQPLQVALNAGNAAAVANAALFSCG